MIVPLLAAGRGWILGRLAAVGLLQAGVLVGFALLVQQIFDRFNAGSGEGELAGPGAALVALTLVAAVLRYFERTDSEQLGQRYVHAVRGQMLERLGRVSVRTLGQAGRGGVLLKFVGDLTALRQWVSLGVARLGVVLLTGTGTVAALAFVSWRLALLVILTVALPGFLVLCSGKPLEHSVRRARRHRGRLSSDIGERVASLAVVQAHGQVKRETRRVLSRSTTLKDAMLQRARWVGIIRALTELAMRLGVVGVLLLGIVEVAAGRLSAGGVVAGMAIAGFLAAPLRELGRAYEYWRGAKVARERILHFLALPDAVPDLKDAPKLRRVRGAVRFDRVSVDGILNGVSARVPAGSRVLITGPNGSGKSTLLWCAARLIEPSAGRVLIDRQDLAKVRLSSVRRHIGFASPDLPLMRGTVKRNITYRDPRAPAACLEDTIGRCGLEPLLADLSGGLHARVTDEGRNLSIGQRQQLMLARAVYDQPRVLLLDEPDTGLDPQARRVLERLIDAYPGTVLLASHRQDWGCRVDDVWTLENGRLCNRLAPVVALEQSV